MMPTTDQLERAKTIKALKPKYEMMNAARKLLYATQTWAEIIIAYPELRRDGWTFKLDNAQTRLGCCHYNKKKVTLSRHLLTDAKNTDIFNTLTHETAHALLGVKTHHGAGWKQLHKALGGNGLRCSESQVLKPKYNYEVRCPNGHAIAKKRGSKEPIYTVQRIKLTRQLRNAICSECRERLDIFKIKYRRVKK